MRKPLLLAMLTLAAIAAHAQRFDWVKTYSGPDLDGSETNNIVGSFVDAEGNFYFLGEFSPSASQSKYGPRIPKFKNTIMRKTIVRKQSALRAIKNVSERLYGRKTNCITKPIP